MRGALPGPTLRAVAKILVPDFDLKRRLGSGESRDRDAVGRRAHVIEAHLLEEVDRRRVAAVFAAHADLQVRPS